MLNTPENASFRPTFSLVRRTHKKQPRPPFEPEPSQGYRQETVRWFTMSNRTSGYKPASPESLGSMAITEPESLSSFAELIFLCSAFLGRSCFMASRKGTISSWNFYLTALTSLSLARICCSSGFSARQRALNSARFTIISLRKLAESSKNFCRRSNAFPACSGVRFANFPQCPRCPP